MQKVPILYDACHAVLSTFDLDEVLQRILSILHDYFQLRHGSVLLLDEKTGMLVVRTYLGSDEWMGKLELALGEGLVGTAAQSKRLVYAPDVTKDPRYIASIPTTRSELAIPLMLRDEVVGVLDCQSEKPDFFDKETIDLLTLFSTQASVGIQNAQLHASERRRTAQLEAINLIARQVTAMTEIRDLVTKVSALILQNFPADHVALLMREPDALVLRHHAGRLTPHFEEGESIPNESACMQALETNSPIIVEEVANASRYVAGFAETRSELILPLISFGRGIGVLTLESTQPNAYQKSDVKALESVADICAAAIQNSEYFEQIRQLAYRDGLTGVFNRRFFESRILEEIERARRYGSVLSVVMIDIDVFKKSNDEFGHLLGDEILKQVSAMFVQQTRKSDIVCRFGGDEFALILPQTNAVSAANAAEKLRQQIASWEFPGVARPVTVSTGIAEFPSCGENRDDLIKAADIALYAAKQNGRNRVIVYNPELLGES
jgi:diguanylate cyclase (GGDEF)-like protein